MKATLFIDKYYLKKDGTCAGKLKVTHLGKNMYIPLNVYHTLSDWQKIKSGKGLDHTLKADKLFLDQIVGKANEVIRNLIIYNFSEFEKGFYHVQPENNVFDHYEGYMEKLKNEGKIGTRNNYKDSLSALKRFVAECNKKIKILKSWVLKKLTLNGLKNLKGGYYKVAPL
jgi:hypothetical protein